MKLTDKVSNFFRNLKGNTIAVYGDPKDEDVIKVREMLGKRLIVTDGDTFVKADKYVLLWEEEKSASFYEKNLKMLADRPVCIRSCLNSLKMQGEELYVFDPEDFFARVYWKKMDMALLVEDMMREFRVAVIGCNRLGQKLLVHGLENSIFDTQRKIRFDVYGKKHHMDELYHDVREIGERVTFHGKWMKHLDKIAKADMIILCDQKDQFRTVDEIRMVASYQRLCVMTSDSHKFEIFGSTDLDICSWKDDVYREEFFFNK